MHEGLWRLCQRAAVRLCALPTSHPLAPHVQRAGRRFVKAHRSALHELLDAYRPWLDIKNTERIRPVRLHPRWTPRHRTRVIQDRKEAAEDDARWADGDAYRVYTDGSDIDGGVGAAALLYKPGYEQPEVLQLHLGPSTRHTVYEAEIVATVLAMELLRRTLLCTQQASIGLDNTAAIQASQLRSPGAGRYLTDMFHAAVRNLKAARPQLQLTLRWVPGHTDIPGNEAADEAAKQAARGHSSPTRHLPKSLRKTLPLSTTRARQNYKAELDRRASERWRTSTRGVRLAPVDKSLPSKNYGALVASLPRRHANLLMQFRTNHVPLQDYLARIGKAPDATCPTCHSAPETVAHFLLACPTYSLHRAVHFRHLGFSGRTLAALLNSKDSLRPLFNFVNATGRLRSVFGALIGPHYPDSEDDSEA